jgi:acyl-CoA thioesterase
VEFFGLETTDDPLRWQLPVVRGICSGFGSLFGGCALGAAIEVLERVTERPLVWATAQFLEFAKPDAVVQLDVTEFVRGHSSSQGRVTGSVADAEIFTVVAALGRRGYAETGEWAQHPHVPAVADSGPRTLPPHLEGTIADRLETRMADARNPDQLDGTPGDGRSALWVRLPDGLEATASALGILGDYVPFGIGQALGHPTRSNSLDNTLRMVVVHPTEWVLADIRVQAVAGGFGHGVVHLWAEDGTLLATASQSTTVREWERAPGAPNAPAGGKTG